MIRAVFALLAVVTLSKYITNCHAMATVTLSLNVIVLRF